MSQYYHEHVINNEELQVRFEIITDNKLFVPLHWHSHLEVLYIVDGEMTVNTGVNQYDISKGDMIVINANEMHSTKMDSKVVYLLLQIPAECFSGCCRDYRLLHFHALFSKDDLAGAHLIEILIQMKDVFQKRDDGYKLCFSSLLYKYLYHLYIEFSERSVIEQGKDVRSIQRISVVIRYVEEYYKGEISLQEAASIAAVSTEYLCRLFKQYTGQTFLEYVMAVRVAKFYTSLQKSDDTIANLLEENGIKNYKVFLREFQKTFGKTPQEIRKSHRK